MINNKNRDRRLELICDLLQTKNKYSKNEIYKYVVKHLKEMPISIRTINYDLEYLKKYKEAPIEMSGKGKNSVYYFVDEFELFKSIISNEDKSDLVLLHSIFSSIPFVNSSLQFEKVLENIGAPNKKAILKYPPIDFEQVIESSLVKKNFKILFDAIIENICILIQYKSFNKSEIDELEFHPYFLKQFNKRWFLIGYNPNTKYIETRGLERIEKIKLLYNKERNNNFYIKPEKYREHLFGVTKTNESAQTIEIKISKNRAPYFISKPIQPTLKQKILKDSNYLISFKCIVNKELIAELLSYGSDVQVIKPKTLKDKMINLLKDAFDNYN